MIHECGVDINEPVVLPSGLRLLHVAAFHKQPQIVSLLINLGANIDVLDDEGGYNPLTMAIIGTNIAAALELINGGADLSIVSQAGRSPMYVAIEKGLTEVVRVLVQKRKIDINASTTREARYLLTHALLLTCLLTYSLTHSLTHLLTHLLTDSLTYSLTHSLIHSLTYLLTYSLTHSLTH
jgi:ankyrin repeat protein